MYRRILVILDGSKLSEAILPEVSKLAAGSDVTVHLVTVAEPPSGGVVAETRPLVVAGVAAPGGVVSVPPSRTLENRGQAIEHAKEELQSYVQSKAAGLRKRGVDVQTQVLLGDPAAEILAYAKAKQIHLIMMATHGRTGLSRVVFGSVAARIVSSAGRPVLLVRPPGLSAGSEHA